jgi:L-rhamnose isomerase
LRAAENAGDYTARLALMEDSKSLPWGAVWEEYCRRNETPADGQWLAQARDYESRVLSKR